VDQDPEVIIIKIVLTSNLKIVFQITIYNNCLGIIAACWATLMYFGMNGYISSTKAIVETKIIIEEQ